MVKLSSQLNGGLTRTQRVVQQERVKRNRDEFNRLKEKAQKIKEEKFKDKPYDEKTYTSFYGNLEPDLKQFFESPENIKENKQQDILRTKEKIEERKAYADKQIIDEKEQYDERNKKLQEKYIKRKRNAKTGEQEEKARDWYKEEKEEIEQDYDEDVVRWEGYKKALGESFKELNRGKNISYEDIEDYAQEYGGWEKVKLERINEGRTERLKQKRKIEKLKEKGYEPQVITSYQNGNPKEVTLSYFNEKTGDWVKVEDFDTGAKKDVTKLKRFGVTEPQTVKLQYLGKEYEFKSNIGVYKDKKGKLVTPYGDTGLTEKDLLKQQRDLAYEKWLKQQNGKPQRIFLNIDTTKKSELPIGYGSQQTSSQFVVNAQNIETQKIVGETGKIAYVGKQVMNPQGVLLYPKTINTRVLEDTGNNVFIKPSEDRKPFSLTKAIFENIDDRVHYEEGLKIIFGVLDEKTKPEKIVAKTDKEVLERSRKSMREYLGEEKVVDVESELKEKAQTEYQTAFERKYMKDLIYGDITPEQAQEEFEKTDVGKVIEREYEKDYQKKIKKIEQDKPYTERIFKGTLEGLEQVGYAVQRASLQFVESPTKTVVGTVGVVGVVEGFNKIPSFVGTGLSGLGVAYGGYKTFSPTSTPIERGTGVIIGSISLASLGYQGYRYLRTPRTYFKPLTTKQLKNLKVEETTFGVDKYNPKKVIYPEQKIGQVATEGRRPLITNRYRQITRNLLRPIGIKPTEKSLYYYRGLPSDKKIPVKIIESSRGVIRVKGLSNYQKALKELVNYGGYTKSQAVRTLRTISPKVKGIYLRSEFTLRGDKIGTGASEVEIRPEKVKIKDFEGGITRGGNSQIYREDVLRKVTNKIGDKYVIEETVKPSKVIFQSNARIRGLPFKKKVYAEYDPFERTVFTKTKKDLFSRGIEYKRVTAEGEFKIGDVKKGEILFDPYRKTAIGDFRRVEGIKVIKPADITKTPYPKSEQRTEFLKNILRGKTKPSKDVEKVLRGFEPQTQQSAYAGTGQYEQTPYTALTYSPQQKPIIIKETGIPKPLNVKSDLGLSSKTLNAVITSLALNQGLNLKNQTRFSSDIKVDNIIKQDNVIENKNALRFNNAQKTGQLTKQQSIQLTSPAVSQQIINIKPTITDPITPKPKPPKPFTPYFFFPPIDRRKKKAKESVKSVYQRAYLPDFTARAIGLKPETITQKQAKQRLKKILTGLEIRKGVRVK